MFHPILRLLRYAAILPLCNAGLIGFFAFSVPWHANAETVTVAALGDSLTAGYGLAPEEGLVPQLEAWLTAAGEDVRLINAGVSGDTTAGGLSRLGWTLTPEVQGLIVTLGGNDMLRGVPPATVKDNLAAILQEAGAREIPVLLVSMSAPGNYGPQYKAEFDAIYPALAQAHGALLFEDFFAPLRAATGDAAAVQRLMQPDGIHPGAEAVGLIVAELGPMVRALIARAREGQ